MLAVALLSVTAISVALAVQARQLATVERQGRERAEQAEDELEKETALSLIGPLDRARKMMNAAARVILADPANRDCPRFC